MVMVLICDRPRSCEREAETHDDAVVEEGGDSRGVGQHDTLLEPRSGYTPTPTLTPPQPSQTIYNSLLCCIHCKAFTLTCTEAYEYLNMEFSLFIQYLFRFDEVFDRRN